MDNIDYTGWQLITLHCSHDLSILVIRTAAVWTWGIRDLIAVDSVNRMTTGNMSTKLQCYSSAPEEVNDLTDGYDFVRFQKVRGFSIAEKAILLLQ